MGALTWSGCTNVRDLGGLPVEGGGVVRDRALVRSDSLTRLDEDGVQALDAYGVAQVIDLRAETEVATPPHPYAGAATYRNEPWVDVSLGEDATLVDFYLGSLDRNTDRIASVVRAFVDAPPGTVVVHCAAGKDRTGIVVALLLLVAGVPRRSVVDDYVLSESEPEIQRLLAGLAPDLRARAEAFSRSRPETLGTALEHLDARYGGVRAYLRDACGLSENELAAVRTRLVDADGGRSAPGRPEHP
jgi:protein tyrosine/serine phosphatase